MDIQLNTKLFDLLKIYPELEQKIINIAPPFKNLKNPILRKTVTKIATIEKVAQIGKLNVMSFINMLRKEVGLPELAGNGQTTIEWQKGEPEWLKEEPELIIDGTEMLNRGEHPLQKVNQSMRAMENRRFLLLKTNFKPIPMIEEMNKQNYEVFAKTDLQNIDQHYTYIRK